MFSCFKCGKTKKSRKSENVYILDFSHHTLDDVPPEIFDYERTLEELNLSSNRITDLPPQLFLCHELKKLHLNNNDICAIPQAIGSLSNLTFLDLFRNNLAYNSISDNIKQCKQLTYLNLSANYLEKLPESITCLINLEQLFLNDTALEFLQANFGRLTNLKILELRVNHLFTLPKSMSRLHNLTHLDIGNNKFNEFPSVICALENLVELIMDDNIVEEIPDEIHNLKKLIYLDLSNNDVNHIPNEIKFLVKLQDLNLSSNQIKHIPKSMGNLTNLITLKLDNNNLAKLPDVFGELKCLEELTLNDNYLQNLPPSVGQLRKLKFLTIDNNYLQFLPKEIASCTALSILSIRGNNLLELPTDFGHLGNLRVLNIVNNSIQVLPLSILNLLKLNALWISDNQSQPMVPLQRDHDDQLNYFLTCYMLPQIKRNPDDESNYNKYSDQTDEELYQSRHKDKVENCDIEPKRKICFSSDPVVVAERPSRLLRSPTPYPKELRNMAKALSEQKNQRSSTNFEMIVNSESPNATKVAATVEIKEARITNNVLLDNGNASSPILDETSSLLQGGTSESGYHGGNDERITYHVPYNVQTSLDQHFMVPPNTDEFDSASSYCHSQLELNLPNHHKVGGVEFDDAISFNSSVSQSQLTKVRYSISSQASNNPSLKLYTEMAPAPLPRVPPPYHHAKIYSKISQQDLSMYDSIRSRTNIGNIYENIKKSEPPATCESPPLPPPPLPPPPTFNEIGELSTIDEEQHLSFENANKLDNITGLQYQRHMNAVTEIELNVDRIINQNGIGSLSVTSNDIKNVNIIDEGMVMPEYDQNQLNERFENGNYGIDQNSNPSNGINGGNNDDAAVEEEIENIRMNNTVDMECERINADRCTPPSMSPTPSMASSILRSPSKPWVFGKHKNPTVIQFSIRKSSNNNTNNGFNIIVIPNMGIYVNDVENNCDAFEKLRKMDKILDIDGFDFTKTMSLKEANQILMNCGNIINIMVSRV